MCCITVGLEDPAVGENPGLCCAVTVENDHRFTLCWSRSGDERGASEGDVLALGACFILLHARMKEMLHLPEAQGLTRRLPLILWGTGRVPG